ncbi:MAG: tyrosine--tRNA ligase [Candidatus Omnitrophica bacterium]|nr:tyrosine--tRNA ligase [Candidatus Omnitrophota bacterium]
MTPPPQAHSVPDQLSLIKRGISELLSEGELVKKLSRGKPLTIKAGFDPTAADLHLGHTVLLRKLAQFQKLGHRVVFLIGDYTGMIGDPSGRMEERPVLTPAQVMANAKTYQKQVSGILDTRRVDVKLNSQWLGPMRLADFLRVTSKLTVPRLLERDDFVKRLKEGSSFTVTEALYPLLQAYDSVALKADVELGGTDQKFNLLLGRALQERFGQEPQVVITLPLLEGTDGVQKMSKSLGNAIGIAEPPEEIYGKVMSIPDKLLSRYFELLTGEDLAQISKMHPMEAKQRLALLLTSQFHGPAAGQKAQEGFNQLFRKREIPVEIPEFKVPARLVKEGKVWVVALLVESGLAPSKAQARRLMAQGGVDLDGKRLTDPEISYPIAAGSILKAGKRHFLRLIL